MTPTRALELARARDLAATAERNRAAAALHVSNGKRRARCVECSTAWPCTTARILGGEA